MNDVDAYHEAGHALLAVVLGGRLQSVTIDPAWDDGPARYGDTRVEWHAQRLTPRELCEKSILVALAGPVAERIHRGEAYHPGLVAEWAADWRLAWAAAESILPDEHRRLQYLERLTVQLEQWLRQDAMWAALAAIVDELSAHETLDGDQVAEIVHQWI